MSALFKTPLAAGTTTIRASAHSGAQIAAVTFTESTVTIPAAPKYFTVSIGDDQNYELRWVPGSANETGFTLWQSLDDGATWQPAAQAPAHAENATIPIAEGATPLWATTADNEAGSSPKTYEPSFALRDDDTDGFDNQTESDLGTKRLIPDTDGDGTMDGSDIDPLDPDLAQPRVPESRYAVIDLSEYGLTLTSAGIITDINNAMQIIGDADDGAWLWENGERTLIPLSWPYEINDSGVVVGQGVYSSDLPSFAATWEKGDTSPAFLFGFEIPLVGDEAILSPPVSSGVGAINNAGVVVGNSWGWIANSFRDSDFPDGSTVSYACMTKWAGSNPVPLGDVYLDVPGSTQLPMHASAVNDIGIVAGSGGDTDGKWKAKVFDSGPMLLPTAFNHYSRALAINKDSVMLGYEYNPEFETKAALWQRRDGVWTNKILAPELQLASGIMRLNDRLEIHADFYDETGKHSRLWQNGKLSNLEERLPEGWTLLAANGINDAGVIVGRAQKTGVQPGDPPAPPVPVAVAQFDLMVRARMGTTPPDHNDWELAATPKSLIVDVNNGLVGGQRRNADTTLPEDEKNFPGSYIDTKRVEPLYLFFPGGGSLGADKVVLRLVSGAPEKVRIFDSDNPPKAVLGAAVGGNQTQYELTAAQKQKGNQIFWIEGIEAGEFTVALERWDENYYNSKPYYPPRNVQFEVNVDRQPTAASDDAKLDARHRVRAIKTASQIKGMIGYLDGKRPLLSWSNAPLRSGSTSSFWVGFNKRKLVPTDPLAWAQVGLQQKGEARAVPHDRALSSFLYAEISANRELYDNGDGVKTHDQRYFRRQFYPLGSPVIGKHSWSGYSDMCKIDYITNPSISRGDTIKTYLQITGATDPQGQGQIPLLSMSGDHSPGQPDIDLSTINFDEYQAGAEMTASVTRLSGTESSPARIHGLQIRTGPRNDISDWTDIDFDNVNLEIVEVNKDGVETVHDGATNQGLSYSHYHIELDGASYIRFWDKYQWTETDPKKW